MRNKIIFLVIGIIVIGVGILFISRHHFSNTGSVLGGGSSLGALLAEVGGYSQKADFVALKSTYQQLINDFPNHKDVGLWQKELDDINLKIVFSPVITGSSQEYEVKTQDTLTKIAKQFNTTIDLIKKSNNLSSDIITPGRKLKIWTGKFSVLVDKSQNTLTLRSNDEIIKTYPVATGAGNSTPIGTFKIVTKLIDPPWYKPGVVIPPGSPENILGTRWMGFDLASYGIHGTTDPSSIGKQATAGCVRMLNTEVEELYMMLPIGTEVTIVD